MNANQIESADVDAMSASSPSSSFLKYAISLFFLFIKLLRKSRSSTSSWVSR